MLRRRYVLPSSNKYILRHSPFLWFRKPCLPRISIASSNKTQSSLISLYPQPLIQHVSNYAVKAQTIPASNNMVDYRTGVAILVLIFYVPTLFLGIWLCLLHGFGRNAGWFFLILLSVIRIVGSSALIAAESKPSVGLITTSIICSSIGLSTLLLMIYGLLKRL